MGTPRVLLVGGAGAFGSRLAETMIGRIEADVIIAGRSVDRARETAAALGAVGAMALDRAHVTANDLQAARATIVIDATGPFQNAQPTLARAAISAGAHYIDLADARDFVAAFPALNGEARAAGVCAITGASSTPALTHVACDQLVAGWTRIDRLIAGISAGARAPRGRGATEAILGWAGAPVRVFEDGAWRVRAGWSRTRRMEIAGLGWRRLALAETPDLDLLVERYQPTDEASFLAGLEHAPLHHLLAAFAWLRRIGVMRTLAPLAPAAQALAYLSGAFGADRGAMIAHAFGRNAHDRPTLAAWTLVAPPGKGPYVPGLPAAAVVRKLLAGALAPGARACVGVLTLADFRDDFERLGVQTQTHETPLVAPFENALGEKFRKAPAAVRALHQSGPVSRFSGTASVKGAASPLAALAASIVGFPRAAAMAPAHVTIRALGADTEEWIRHIGGAGFRSVLRTTRDGDVEETFGLATFRMRLDVDGEALRMAVTGWRVGALLLPAWLAPRSVAVEREDAEGRFVFDVPIFAPLIGRLVHYVGTLSPSVSPGTARTPDERGSAPETRAHSA